MDCCLLGSQNLSMGKGWFLDRCSSSTVLKRQQIEINFQALFSLNEDQSAGLILFGLRGIKGNTGEQTGERNDFLKSEI